MKKVSFLLIILGVAFLPAVSNAMELSDVLTQYYVEKSAPAVLGASTVDGGYTTNSTIGSGFSSEAKLNLLRGLRYAEGSAEVVSVQLKSGMKSDEVKKLQIFLIAKGYLNADPTGFYGGQTTAAVKAFQMKNGIVHTGRLVGPSTRAAITADVEALTPNINQ